MKKLQRLESMLNKSMFGIVKKTRSTPLLKAINVEKVEELLKKSKIKFFNRLMEFEITSKLANEIGKNVIISKHKNGSLIAELKSLCNTENFNEIFYKGKEVMDKIEQVKRQETNTNSVNMIKECLKMTGEERIYGLYTQLKINFDKIFK
jgi:GTP-sensing pleiotropic transcriptional regulator CodY